jgi:hypothetical protein
MKRVELTEKDLLDSVKSLEENKEFMDEYKKLMVSLSKK